MAKRLGLWWLWKTTVKRNIQTNLSQLDDSGWGGTMFIFMKWRWRSRKCVEAVLSVGWTFGLAIWGILTWEPCPWCGAWNTSSGLQGDLKETLFNQRSSGVKTDGIFEVTQTTGKDNYQKASEFGGQKNADPWKMELAEVLVQIFHYRTFSHASMDSMTQRSSTTPSTKCLNRQYEP